MKKWLICTSRRHMSPLTVSWSCVFGSSVLVLLNNDLHLLPKITRRTLRCARQVATNVVCLASGEEQVVARIVHPKKTPMRAARVNQNITFVCLEMEAAEIPRRAEKNCLHRVPCCRETSKACRTLFTSILFTLTTSRTRWIWHHKTCRLSDACGVRGYVLCVHLIRDGRLKRRKI